MISDERLAEIRTRIRREGKGRGGESEPGSHSALVEELFAEVESLRDSTLQKDFLALYQSARMVTSAPHAIGSDVEGLALHVVRLAPLYDDVRTRLNLHSHVAREAARTTLGGPLPYLHRSHVPRPQHEALPLAEVACQLVDAAVETGMITGAHVTQHGDDVVVRLTRSSSGIPLDPEHTVRVMQPDGSVRLECDHKFLGTSDCVRCRKPFAELRAEQALEANGYVRADQVDLVSIPLGPVLLARVQALVATGRLGRSLGNVAQTLFILGLLNAEGQDPSAHFGAPEQHISVEGVFVRFALPHDAAQAPDRAEVLRDLFAWVHAWLGDEDPLAKAPAAALAALPR